MPNHNSNLQSNNTSLQEILNTVNQLQTGVSPDIYRSLLDGSIVEIRDDTITTLRTQGLQNCYQLQIADFPNVTYTGVNCFQGCTKLASVNMPKLQYVHEYVFHTCRSLVSVSFPIATSIQKGAFNGCTSLITADLPLVTALKSAAFSSCTALTALILRANSVCSLYGDALISTPIWNGSGLGFVYVPSTLVDSYKSATNWSYCASQIRAIEDYPHITGG